MSEFMEVHSSPAMANHPPLDLQDSWLPITESRNGNAYYSAFHTLSSGIGFQALLLPLAFTTLGWVWGTISLSLAFAWQLYTIWLLIQLHEPVPGTRYSRYLRLSMAAFGEKLGKLLALFPTLYLAGGTCVSLIMMGGSTLKIFFHTVCSTTCNAYSPSTVEWYIVFVSSAIVLAQLPNLNSMAGVSLIAAITAVTYCTVTWTLSVFVSKPKPINVSYEPVRTESDVENICSMLNALGIIVFSFRGHNLVLEIQGTMPSSTKIPSRVPMWKGVRFSYLIIAGCLFPMAIGGYWAYGNLIPANGSLLSAIDQYHREETPKSILGLASLLVVVNSLTSFQIYAMPVFDNLEFRYTSRKNGPCPWWLRMGIRIFFGCLTFFISVALPFLKSLTALLGGVALPVTLAYPCLMWVRIKKPVKFRSMWWLNWALGSLGMLLSVLVVLGAIWARRGDIGGGGEQRNGRPIIFGSNLILPQLLRQLRSRNHPLYLLSPPSSPVPADVIMNIRHEMEMEGASGSGVEDDYRGGYRIWRSGKNGKLMKLLIYGNVILLGLFY